EAGRAHLDLATRLLDRLAHVARFERRELLRLRPDALRQPEQHPRPLDRRGAAPLAFLVRPACRGHRYGDVLGPSLGDPGEDVAGGGLDDRGATPGPGGHPLAVDPEALFREIAISHDRG